MDRDAAYYARRSEERFQKGDIEGGRADLDRAIQLDPDNVGYRWSRARMRYDGERYALAVEDLSKIIQISSDLNDLEEAYTIQAIAHEALGQYKELVKDLDWLIDHGFGDELNCSWRAYYKSQWGDFEGAIEDLTEAHEMSPANTETLFLRGQAHYHAKRYEEAIRDLTSILSVNKDAPTILASVHHWRGKAYYQLGRYDEALIDFNEDMRLSHAKPFTDATAYMRTFAHRDLPTSE